tara:strand:+ start:353 stop:652 length:300 start_codon:yes stop_codon:yes gene_type:complete
MSKTQDYPLPTVHLNGTCKGDLLQGNVKILSAINELREAISSCPFHGRDYYVQDSDPMKDAFNDDNAFSAAYDERRKHLDNIGDFEKYIERHIEHIVSQ